MTQATTRGTPLTQKDLQALFGAFIGGLCNHASTEVVRTAMRWWVETEEAWAAMKDLMRIANHLEGHHPPSGIPQHGEEH